MIQNPDISLADIIRKKRSDTIRHLIQHRPQTPPVCFDAVVPCPILQGYMGKLISIIIHFQI